MKRLIDSIYVLRRLHESNLYALTPRLLADLFDLDRRDVHRLVARLKSEGLIQEVERGKYLLLGLEPARVLSNPLFIASHLATPAYVSYWSALHFYGFTEQVPRTTFVATTKKKRPLAYRGFRFQFVTVKPAKFFGYRREPVGDLPVVIADEAKAIVDSLDLLHYAGGIGEVAQALQAALPEGVEVSTLIEYANRMGNKSLGSRLGYLLECLGQPTNGLLHSDSPVKLDPSRPRTGSTAPWWQTIVNVPQDQLLAREGVG
jgi:predicted transcriptional regulator of viral defense system